MKIIEINIGLSSKTQADLNPIAVLNALTGRGFTLLHYHVATSTCKDGEERCLAVKAECPADWQTQLSDLSDKLGQDCIAIVGFIGHSPYDTFCADLWKSPVQAEETFNGFTRETFKTYLRENIIPDSRESGFEGYAEDLETALHFLEN